MCPEDMLPEEWRVLVELSKRMTPGEKLTICLEMSEAARQLAKAALRKRYPDVADEEIFHRFARMNLGPELFYKVYGDVLPPGTEPWEMTHFGNIATTLGRRRLLEEASELGIT
jgi:hypothetical protein